MGHHKDGLTADCPHFEERHDFQGGHFIHCTLGTKSFYNAWERNQFYKTICCRHGEHCELIDIDKRRRPNK